MNLLSYSWTDNGKWLLSIDEANGAVSLTVLQPDGSTSSAPLATVTDAAVAAAGGVPQFTNPIIVHLNTQIGAIVAAYQAKQAAVSTPTGQVLAALAALKFSGVPPQAPTLPIAGPL